MSALTVDRYQKQNKKEQDKMNHRTLREIAIDIKRNWAKISDYARPYLDAMSGMNSVTDRYYCDDGRGIVAYFLANTGGWRGADAKRIKAEPRGLLA